MPSVIPQRWLLACRRSISRAQLALDSLRSQGFEDLADELAPRVCANAALGRMMDHEIRAAIALYSLYFATSRTAALRHANGPGPPSANTPAIADKADRKAVDRMLGSNEIAPQEDVDRVQDLLKTFAAANFPMNAFAAWANSRRQYNEIRRFVRPYRLHNRITLGYARRQIAKARAAARKAMAALSPQHADYAANVRAWLDFLDVEESHMTPPSIKCSPRTRDQYLSIFHDDCSGWANITPTTSWASSGNSITSAGGIFRSLSGPKKTHWSSPSEKQAATLLPVRPAGKSSRTNALTNSRSRRTFSRPVEMCRVIVFPNGPRTLPWEPSSSMHQYGLI